MERLDGPYLAFYQAFSLGFYGITSILAGLFIGSFLFGRPFKVYIPDCCLVWSLKTILGAAGTFVLLLLFGLRFYLSRLA